MKSRFSSSNPRLLELHEKHASAYMSSQPPSESYSYRVQKLLLQQLREETPGIEIVADHLSMSVRSLQMKLKDEGTSYQKILNHVRKHLAIAYLQEPKVTKGEIAHLLGFSEISVFSRTFKKWTGKSPSEYQSAVAV
ncbi:helix-turn-helix transcriptional regulator [Pontibacter sp. G13]|uniref:helix-turn-helix transcriptional regulator n=1 Tax=Pontibacter sp. G13 TaxID=3074898 RepID=UPI00288BA372|nr:helix-turn-helix transcriptional regulator [Pontibacter sp. G13]WNJ16224.1 helix-turn-helix transcriptional regulator [Pontibacter sp. G13]